MTKSLNDLTGTPTLPTNYKRYHTFDCEFEEQKKKKKRQAKHMHSKN